MSESLKPEVGSIGWTDLTVSNAEEVRNFYAEVVGWKHEPVDMGGYDDFNMIASNGRLTAGICHARGTNQGLPPQWLMYITVENVQKSVESALALGGEVLVQPKSMGGYGMYCVIQDPSGAVVALVEPAK